MYLNTIASLALLFSVLPNQVFTTDTTRDPGLVAKLKTAATQLDRLNLLSKDSDWLYDFTAQKEYTYSPGSVVNANVSCTIPLKTLYGLRALLMRMIIGSHIPRGCREWPDHGPHLTWTVFHAASALPSTSFQLRRCSVGLNGRVLH